jgi:hypothetical protein
MEQATQDSVLVVVEGYAACPLWMAHWGTEPEGEWTMLEQEEWEPRSVFIERLRCTLDRGVVGASETVVLVTSHRTDDATTAARFELSAVVLNHLTQQGGGQLLLTRGHGADARSEQKLGALAEELTEEWSDVRVAVRAADHAPASHVRKSSLPPRHAARAFGDVVSQTA